MSLISSSLYLKGKNNNCLSVCETAITLIRGNNISQQIDLAGDRKKYGSDCVKPSNVSYISIS